MSTTNPHHEGEAEIDFKPLDDANRMQINPCKLSIVWGKDSRYWKVPNDEGMAELYQVSWLEVTGCVSKTDPKKDYEVGFKLSLTPDAFGWSSSPIYILVKRGKTGKFKGHKFNIDTTKESQGDIVAKTPKIEATDAEGENAKVYFGLYEVWRGKWKGGLKIHNAFIQEV